MFGLFTFKNKRQIMRIFIVKFKNKFAALLFLSVFICILFAFSLSIRHYFRLSLTTILYL